MREDTGSITIEDRFYNFVTKDFPDFRTDVGERLAGVETQMRGVHGRLKKIEGGTGNGVKTAFLKWLPWLITAVVGGAALGGAAIAGGLN